MGENARPELSRAEAKEVRPPGAEEAAADITRDMKAFTAAIRNRIFTFLRGLVMEDYEAALANLNFPQGSRGAVVSTAGSGGVSPPAATPGETPAEPAGEDARATNPVPSDADGQPWTPARLQQALDDYHADHERLCLDPNARNIRHTYVIPSDDKKSWRVQQMLVDPAGDNDWVAEFDVNLAESRKLGEPFLILRHLGSLTR